MEFKGIFTNRRVLIIFIILVVGAVGIYMYRNQPKDYEEQGVMAVPQVSYESAQAEHVDTYSEYLNKIIKQSDSLSGISIFQNTDSYSFKNVQKTRESYEALCGISLTKGNYEGIESIISFSVVEYLIFIFGFVLVWHFFEDEKKGLKGISYAAPKGRIHLTLRRAGVLFVGNALFVAVIYIALFVCSIIVYGMPGDLTANVQSMVIFRNCTFKISVLGYVGLNIIFHIVKALVLSLMVWMILLIFRNQIIATAVLVIILSVEGVLYHVLSVQSNLVMLKYINLFQLVQPGDILYKYRNFKLGETPVNCFSTFCLLMIAVGVISLIVCCCIANNRRTVVVPGRIVIAFTRILNKIQKILHIAISHLPVIGMEFYKILISQKGVVIIALWLYLLISQLDTNNVFLMGSASAMKEIYEEYSGEDDGRLREYLSGQEAVLEQAYAEYDAICDSYEAGEISEEEYEMAGFNLLNYRGIEIKVEEIQDKLAYIDIIKKERGIDVWFVDEKAYSVLWTENGLYADSDYKKQEFVAIAGVLLLILLLSYVFSYDSSCGMEMLIRSTPKGRQKLFNVKIMMAGVICICLCLITYGLELYEVSQIFSINCLNAPVQSLSFMKDFPLRISIFAFLIMVECVHLVVMFAIAMIVYAMSIWLKGIKAVMLSLVVLAAPAGLKNLGFNWCEYVSVVQPLVYIEPLQEHGFIYSVAAVGVVVLLGAVSYIYTRKRWCYR